MPQQTNLGAMVTLYRTVHRRALRDVAADIGVSHATLARLEHGRGVDADTLLKLWLWMMTTAKTD